MKDACLPLVTTTSQYIVKLRVLSYYLIMALFTAVYIPVDSPCNAQQLTLELQQEGNPTTMRALILVHAPFSNPKAWQHIIQTWNQDEKYWDLRQYFSIYTLSYPAGTEDIDSPPELAQKLKIIIESDNYERTVLKTNRALAEHGKPLVDLRQILLHENTPLKEVRLSLVGHGIGGNICRQYAKLIVDEQTNPQNGNTSLPPPSQLTPYIEALVYIGTPLDGLSGKQILTWLGNNNTPSPDSGWRWVRRLRYDVYSPQQLGWSNTFHALNLRIPQYALSGVLTSGRLAPNNASYFELQAGIGPKYGQHDGLVMTHQAAGAKTSNTTPTVYPGSHLQLATSNRTRSELEQILKQIVDYTTINEKRKLIEDAYRLWMGRRPRRSYREPLLNDYQSWAAWFMGQSAPPPAYKIGSKDYVYGDVEGLYTYLWEQDDNILPYQAMLQDSERLERVTALYVQIFGIAPTPETAANYASKNLTMYDLKALMLNDYQAQQNNPTP